jgi:hypothetical protein
MQREPLPEVHVVGCDHMTYFSSAASAAGIRKALA